MPGVRPSDVSGVNHALLQTCRASCCITLIEMMGGCGVCKMLTTLATLLRIVQTQADRAERRMEYYPHNGLA